MKIFIGGESGKRQASGSREQKKCTQRYSNNP
jgi:hypothetical protein